MVNRTSKPKLFLLNRILQKNGNLGKSFYDIVNDMRVAKAKELLADPKLKIGEVNDLVGYSDPAHFSRIFKKLAGISPADFRNSL